MSHPGRNERSRGATLTQWRRWRPSFPAQPPFYDPSRHSEQQHAREMIARTFDHFRVTGQWIEPTSRRERAVYRLVCRLYDTGITAYMGEGMSETDAHRIVIEALARVPR